jgi:C-terminal peptidase prc
MREPQSFASRAIPACLLAALAAPAGAQILDDTRGLGARAATARRVEIDQLRKVSEVFALLKTDFVDVLEEPALAERCTSAMDRWLGDNGRGAAIPPPAASAERSAERIGRYWKQVSQQFPDEVDFEKLAGACVHGMVDQLDRRTEYLDRAKFRDLLAGARGTAGIGVELELLEGVATVVAPIEGAPAARAGLRPGDRLLQIDGTETRGLKLEEVARLLRGKAGSTVALQVRREGSAAPLGLEAVREAIRAQSVKSRLLEGGVLYVRISQFAERTLDDFARALEAGYRSAGDRFAGVVLDLRGNPGGLFHSCIGVSAAFLPESALVVETRGRARDSTQRLHAKPQDYRRGTGRRPWDPPAPSYADAVRSAPLAVLVNRRSAACSEIVAAALQDHKRAKVVGEKTFGLGTVQTIIPLGGSEALRLTTARFYRPGGEAIEEKAVTPDVLVEQPERFRGYGDTGDPGLPVALEILGERAKNVAPAEAGVQQ